MSLYVNIYKDFGRFKLDIELEAGNCTHAFLGASGCGKSMTLRCIAGTVKPDRGKIVLDGITLFDSERRINLHPQKRNVGLLFQNYALFPNMTAAQNIACGMRRESAALRKEQLPPLIRMLHLDGLEKHYPSQLSGGQQQRVALARILAAKPNILMLDEPFSALDSYLRWQLEREVSGILQQFDGTTLFVSHNRDEVYRMCDHISVVDDGKLSVTDEKWALFNNPRTYAAALLTGCKNILPAERAGEFALRIPAWNNKVLHTTVPVSENVRFAGIRARQMQHAVSPDDTNTVAYQMMESIEDTFSHICMIRITSKNDDEKNASLLRWEIPKSSAGCPSLQSFITIQPEHVLPLLQ